MLSFCHPTVTLFPFHLHFVLPFCILFFIIIPSKLSAHHFFSVSLVYTFVHHLLSSLSLVSLFFPFIFSLVLLFRTLSFTIVFSFSSIRLPLPPPFRLYFPSIDLLSSSYAFSFSLSCPPLPPPHIFHPSTLSLFKPEVTTLPSDSPPLLHLSYASPLPVTPPSTPPSPSPSLPLPQCPVGVSCADP